MTQPAPIVVAVALSLYGFNVSPVERAQKLYDHFEGACAELSDLITILSDRGQFAATELAMPTALVYVEHAMERYGEEAAQRVAANLGLSPDSEAFMSKFLRGDR